MDISFWIQCNPKITVEHTAKKYFGRFLYKLVVYCPAGRLIDSKGAMTAALEHRKQVTKNINHAGWWGNRLNKDLASADVEFLTVMRDIRHDRTLGFKLRVEEPLIQIYANSDVDLQNLVKTHFNSINLGYIKSVAGPEDDRAEQILNSGAILRRESNGYQYKIILKDGRYTPEIKQSIFEYLKNQGSEQVRIPKSTRDMLYKSTGFIWNAYFYANDPSVTTFLNLISPGIISNCHELVVLADK